MRITQQYISFGAVDGTRIIRNIEQAARTCYLSSHRIGDFKNAKKFVAGLIKSGHDSTLEHVSFQARVITNRGVSHEWVRHRVGCSYSQESTRYCNYGNDDGGITVIWPWYLGDYAKQMEAKGPQTCTWLHAMTEAENSYKTLLHMGAKPEMARGVLPNDLKTEFVTTMTARAWRHFFKLRCAKAAHPQIRELALGALRTLSAEVPVLFDDLAEEFADGGGVRTEV